MCRLFISLLTWFPCLLSFNPPSTLWSELSVRVILPSLAHPCLKIFVMPFGLDPDFLSVFNQALLVIPPLCLFQLPLHPRFSIFTWSVPLTPLPAFSWTFHSPTCWTRLLWSLFSLPQVELVDFRGTWDRLLLLQTQGCCLQFSLLH